MTEPLVSILIATVNRAEFVGDAIRSAQYQTYSNIEIIIQDNFSQDDTSTVVRRFTDDPRVSYYRTSELLPMHENWNLLASRSHGDYVVFLGDDDILHPRFVEHNLRAHEQFLDCAFSYSRAILFSIPPKLGDKGRAWIMYPESLAGEDILNYDEPGMVPIQDEALLEFAMRYANFLPTQFSGVFFERKRLFNKLPFEKTPGPDYLLLPKLYLDARYAIELRSLLLIVCTHSKSTVATVSPRTNNSRPDLSRTRYLKWPLSLPVMFKEIDERILESKEFQSSRLSSNAMCLQKLSNIKCAKGLSRGARSWEISFQERLGYLRLAWEWAGLRAFTDFPVFFASVAWLKLPIPLKNLVRLALYGRNGSSLEERQIPEPVTVWDAASRYRWKLPDFGGLCE